MKILALEFSSNSRSVALAEASETEFRVLASVQEDSPNRSTGLVLIERALRQAELSVEQVDLLAIDLGPGSYAGIRSAIAISQGWQLAREIPLVGIGTVDVLSADAQQRGFFGEVTIVIDAQRGEACVARLNISQSLICVIEPLKIIPATALDCRMLIGPEASKFNPAATNLYPSAATLARLAAHWRDYRAGEQLEPIYLREASFVKAPPPRFGPGQG